MIRRLVPVVALAASVLALAGCGSGHRTTAARADSQQILAECMRAHGVSNFPDPIRGPGGGEGLPISASPGSDTLTVEGTTFSGPTFTAAVRTCRLFGGGDAPPAVSATQKRRLLAFAACMRSHGAPNYADPTFPPGGGVDEGSNGGVNLRSPATAAAATTCNPRVGL